MNESAPRGGAKSYRIATRFSLLLLAITSVILAAQGLYGHFSTRADREAVLQAQNQAALERLGSSLPGAIFNFDEEQIEKILRAELSAAAIVGVTITRDGKPVAGAMRNRQGETVTLKGATGGTADGVIAADGRVERPLEHAEGGKREAVGTATLHYSRAGIENALREQLVVQVVEAFILLGALLVATWIALSRVVMRPLAALRQALADVATGEADLTRRLEPGCCVETAACAASFNTFVARLEGVVAEVQGVVGTSTELVQRIAAESHDLSNKTASQAAGLQQTSATLAEIKGAVARNVDAADEARHLVQRAQAMVQRSGSLVEESVGSMSELNTQSRRMADIIGVIDSISFQTNILALNAAVEAARAGEQGRGFAVVASEVRSLAQRSAGAAREIRQLITESVERVERGSARIESAGKSMAEVVQAIGQVASIAERISDASHAQRTGIEQIHVAVAEIDAATQANAGSAEQCSSSALQARQHTLSLAQAVAVFTVRAQPAAAPA